MLQRIEPAGGPAEISVRAPAGAKPKARVALTSVDRRHKTFQEEGNLSAAGSWQERFTAFPNFKKDPLRMVDAGSQVSLCWSENLQISKRES